MRNTDGPSLEASSYVAEGSGGKSGLGKSYQFWGIEAGDLWWGTDKIGP